MPVIANTAILTMKITAYPGKSLFIYNNNLKKERENFLWSQRG